jgi:CHASE3 domain sensor protein
VEVQRVVLTILAVTAMAASVLYASHAQRETAELHAHETAVAGGLLADVNRSDGALSTYAVSGDPEALDDYEAGLARVRRALVTAATAAGDDAQESEAVADQRRLVAQWTRLVDRALAAPAAAGRRAGLRDDTLARHDLVDELVAANERLQARQAVMAAAEDRRASWVPPVLILALSLLFGAAAAIAGYRARSEERRTTAKRLLQGRFGEAIQASDSQAEAHRLLKTHLERTIPGSTITVLNRNNSADRLEASTPLVEGSPLAEALVDARPRSCMAVRLSRSFSQGEAGDEVLSCELCGASASDTTCQPLLVGGEVIGAALAATDDRIEASSTGAAPEVVGS